MAGTDLLAQNQRSERSYPFHEEKLVVKHCSLDLRQDMEASGSPVSRKRDNFKIRDEAWNQRRILTR